MSRWYGTFSRNIRRVGDLGRLLLEPLVRRLQDRSGARIAIDAQHLVTCELGAERLVCAAKVAGRVVGKDRLGLAEGRRRIALRERDPRQPGQEVQDTPFEARRSRQGKRLRIGVGGQIELAL